MSAILYQKINQEMERELTQTITASTIETFDQIFGYKLSFNENSQHYKNDNIIANVEFWENFETFNVCFIFSKELIMSLLGYVYGHDAKHSENIDEICKDAVCELVNIISNKIKVYINKKGFNSIMEIPSVEILKEIDPGSMRHNINVSFCPLESDTRDNVIYIGLKEDLQ